jgi:hypothetical protein
MTISGHETRSVFDRYNIMGETTCAMRRRDSNRLQQWEEGVALSLKAA